MPFDSEEMPNCARFSKCGNKAEKFMSGTPICWKCWYLVKLDKPAASHWARVAKEFLSNVDVYDLQDYLPACGLSKEEAYEMLDSARKVLQHSEEVLAQ